MRRTADLGAALLLLAAVWTVLLAGRTAGPAFGLERAERLSCAAATVVVLLARGRRPGPAWAARAALGLAAGAVSYPAWVACVGALGVAAGLAVPAPPAGSADWLCALALAPLFEELLYRERLLAALRGALGAPLALAASSALFALPHGEPWSVLGTFVVGLGLGALVLLGAGVAVCVGVHAGLNLGALAWGALARAGAACP